jgi:hypothetical protein
VSLPGAATVIERAVKVSLAGAYRTPQLEFGDLDNGYALFLDGQRAALYRTKDGGISWTPLTHPEPEAENHQIYVADGQTVVLLAEPHGWYASRDSGQTWRFQAYDPNGVLPEEYPEYSPRVVDAEGHTWEVRVDVGVFRVTRDGQEMTVPALPANPISYGSVETSPDGRDVWLIAYADNTSASGSRSVMAKVTGLPLIWRLDGEAWSPYPVTGVKEDSRWSYTARPAGAGVLILTTPQGTGYLSGEFQLVPGTPKLGWIGVLGDGTLTGVDESTGARYLSKGIGADRDWIKVQLSRE